MIQLLEFCCFNFLFSYLPDYCLKYILCLFVFYFFEKYQTKIVRKYFHFELASGMDLVFDYEGKQNQSIIVACSIIDVNFDESIKDTISKNIENEKKYHKLQEILFKNPLIAYWKKDLNYNPDNHFQFINKEINNEKELYKMMAKELSTPFRNEHPKWKFIIIKKYKKTKGASIMKFHHTLADGISMLSFFIRSNNMENAKFVNLPKISTYKWIFLYLSLIVLGPYFLFLNLVKKGDNNKIHGFELSGKKKAFSLHINRPLTELKTISNQLRISINDLFSSVLMECLSEYYHDKFNDVFHDSIMFLPISLRPLPNPRIACPLNNTMIPLFANMKIIKGDDKELVAKQYGKLLLKIKNSFEAPIVFLLIHYAPKLLPTIAFETFYKYMSKKPTFGFSNVPGPLHQLKVGKANVENIFFYVPTMSSIGLGVSLFTYNNSLVLGVQADEKIKIDPEEFAKKYQKIMDVYIEQAMSRSPIMGKSPGEKTSAGKSTNKEQEISPIEKIFAQKKTKKEKKKKD